MILSTFKQKETATIYIAQDGAKVVGCKDRELAVKYFYERYGVLPNHVITCTYYLTDQLLVNGKHE
jgi:hypothetical protein